MQLDESKYPHIYAVAFILHHGEPDEFRVDNCGYSEETLGKIEASLAALPFNAIVRYCMNLDNQVIPEMAAINAFMCDNQLALDFPEEPSH